MAIEPTELRLYNYVQVKNGPEAYVFNIMRSACRVQCDNELDDLRLSYNDIEPIPLTEDWLIDFGFKEKKGTFYYDFNENSIEVCDGSVSIWPPDGCTGGHSVEVFCSAVHQLQNLYFALTGKELTKKEPQEKQDNQV